MCVSVLRLFLSHLMQPAAYALVLFHYEPQIDRVQFHLGLAVLAREASYALVIMYALCTRPAFLLVNLDSHRAGKGRMGQKILYVLCPEKFVAYAALPATPGLVFRYLLLPLDCCALGGVCLHDGDLPAPLAASYIITALAFLVFWRWPCALLSRVALRTARPRSLPVARYTRRRRIASRDVLKSRSS